MYLFSDKLPNFVILFIGQKRYICEIYSFLREFDL